MAGGYTRILNVFTHRKVMAGAVEMDDPSIYPAAPATMQPTARPTMIEMFLRKGEPNSSVRMMETNDRNPRPIISGLPHSAGRGALFEGQYMYEPEVGRPSQLEPPPQLGMPEEPMRDAPMRRMTVPVTMGGKMRLRVRGGTKDMNISRKEHMREVPAAGRVSTDGGEQAERPYQGCSRRHRGRLDE